MDQKKLDRLVAWSVVLFIAAIPIMLVANLIARGDRFRIESLW